MKTTAHTLKEIENIKDYERKADEFIRLTGSTLQIRFIETGLYFGDTDEKDKRDIYEFKLSKGGREYVSKFGDSLSNTWKRHGNGNENEGRYIMREISKGRKMFTRLSVEKQNEEMKSWDYHSSKPSNYSILACLQGYEPPATFDDFIAESGYEINSKKSHEDALTTYGNLVKEYTSLCTLYNNKELEALNSIR